MNAIVAPPLSAPAADDAFLAMIERAWRDQTVDVDKLDRLLTLREREWARVAQRAFDAAMSAAQREMEPIRADCTNTHANSRYASLAALDSAVRAIYTRHGFNLTFDTAPALRADEVCVVCDVAHSAGHTRRHTINMPCECKGARGGDVMNRTHAVGSGISYARRYLLGMIFNLVVSRDDDGNAAGTRRSAPARPRTVTPSPRRIFEDGLAPPRSRPVLVHDERNPPPIDDIPDFPRRR